MIHGPFWGVGSESMNSELSIPYFRLSQTTSLETIPRHKNVSLLISYLWKLFFNGITVRQNSTVMSSQTKPHRVLNIVTSNRL
jgi:hypothetical protein